ncbi:uncharacterized protein LOC124890644, partial [Capsicum annuum]|uniref:uncharacterized protein LOC124890644 n=1 Tax=Capsicum annuum TaxID=4072 RepID=UPI001FB0EFE6
VQSQDHLLDLNCAPCDEGDEDDCEEDDVCGEVSSEEYWDIGDVTYEYEHCGACFWYEERINKKIKSKRPIFSLCCNHGKIKFPKSTEPPQIVRQLLFGSVLEVAALVVEDFEPSRDDRDIVIESRSGQLKSINELNAAYLSLQYPIIFPYGEDGYREDIHYNGVEIPSELLDPHYYKEVQLFMMHGPCDPARNYSPCMHDGRCTKNFPKKFIGATTIDEDGYPIYRRREDGRTIKKDGIGLDNRSIKYLFKYVNKGNDCVTATFSQSANEEDSSNVDEINMYYDCRYISSSEASWRILEFPIQYRQSLAERLAFHLKNEQNVIFSDDDPINDVTNRPSARKSMFLSWFEENKEFLEARELTYAEFLLKFVWKKDSKKWEKRKTSAFSIRRIFFVPPGSGELYYLRLLLNVIRGAKIFEDLKKVNNRDHTTSRDACYALGLLDDDKEYVDSINEAKAEMTDDELRNHCLQRLKKILKGCGKSFQDFSTMPRPVYNEKQADNANRLIHDELHYNRHSLLVEHQQLVMNLRAKQKLVYEKIMAAVNEDKGEFFFLYGHGGTGKTFIWRTLSSGIRSRGNIVLTVASSDIASLLLPRVQTSHSRFAISLNPTEDATCNIKQGSPLANLIVKTKLIIWNEAPMMHRYYFKDLDHTLQDILRFKNTSSLDKPFGGKTVVLSDPISAIVDSTYPEFYCHSSDLDYLQQRAILAPTLDM